MKKIAPDKWKHFYAGIFLGLVLQAFFLFLLDDQLTIAFLISMGLVVAISYGFELFSKITGMGHHDLLDAVASIIGGMLGIVLTLSVHLLL